MTTSTRHRGAFGETDRLVRAAHKDPACQPELDRRLDRARERSPDAAGRYDGARFNRNG